VRTTSDSADPVVSTTCTVHAQPLPRRTPIPWTIANAPRTMLTDPKPVRSARMTCGFVESDGSRARARTTPNTRIATPARTSSTPTSVTPIGRRDPGSAASGVNVLLSGGRDGVAAAALESR
jgi:hypothetical protein